MTLSEARWVAGPSAAEPGLFRHTVKAASNYSNWLI
jgi:hypothetical protein